MAYSAGQWLITVRGNLTLGEVWTNTWCFQGDPDTFDVDNDVQPDLNGIYADLHGFASWFHTDTTSEGATATNLASGISHEMPWAPTVGAAASDPCPTQLALRISLSSGQSHGGPFLAGFASGAIGPGGRVENGVITDIGGALEDRFAALDAAGAALALHKPSTTSVVLVTKATLGRRFDVIRRRANQVAEAAATIPLP